jgi:hypothetical protein
MLVLVLLPLFVRPFLALLSIALHFLRKLPDFLVKDTLQRSLCLAFRETTNIEIVCRILKEPENEFRKLALN